MSTQKQGIEAATASILEALAHPIRIRILRSLLDCSCCQCELASKLDEHPVTISRHLAILTRAGLVTIAKEGTKTFPKPSYPEIKKMLDLAEGIVHKTASERVREARSFTMKSLRA
jgi:DNA-binding transcriptional ArsR family regulator